MATRNIVPRADNEGGIGTALKAWATGFIKAITATTVNALSLAAAAVGFTISGGATSKTLTVSGDATISETPPLNANVINGDGTAGRVLRSIRWALVNGTNAQTIKSTITSLWNGDANAEQNNIARNATTGVYSLDAAGNFLTLLNAGISGNLVAVISVWIYANYSATVICVQTETTGFGLRVLPRNAATGAPLVWDVLLDTGIITIDVVYLTSA